MRMSRVFRAVRLRYRLATPRGASSDTLERRWVFEVPAARDHEEAWRELLHRIFYDRNVDLQRAEPGDPNWLAMDRFEVSPIDLEAASAWTGERGPASIHAHVPWHAEMTATSPACWWVDDEGRYDGMEADDFSELIALRRFAAGELDEAGLVRLLDAIYPGRGDRIFADRGSRLAKIACVRPPTGFRKPPGAAPIVSGPPLAAHVAPQSAGMGAPRRLVPRPASVDRDVRDDPLDTSLEIPPMRRRWLALSLAIAAVVVVVLVVVVGAVALLRPGPIERRRAERAAEAEVVERAIAPLVTAWPGLQDEAKVRIKAAIELLTTASAPAEGGCEGLSGPLTVVHRWTLERLAADQREPWGGPTWLNSPAWNLLAGRTPLERTVEHYGRRDEVVRAALAGPCVGVLETDRRFGPEVSAQSFRSGNVDGVLRIVCVEDPRIACEAPIVSAPAERSFGAHLDADEAAALGVAASDAYWSAIAEAVAERGPGLGLVRGDR